MAFINNDSEKTWRDAIKYTDDGLGHFDIFVKDVLSIETQK